MDLSHSTWRILGLSVAAGYIGLGSLGFVLPTLAAKNFGLYPAAASNDGTTKPRIPLNADVEAHVTSIENSVLLLGARDVSIGLALSKFAHDGQLRETGTLILAGMVLCVADVWQIWRARGAGWGGAFAAGAGIWAVIGLGLVQV
jgi:hypothetical protein